MAKRIGFIALVIFGVAIGIFDQMDPVAAAVSENGRSPVQDSPSLVDEDLSISITQPMALETTGTFNVQIQALEVTQGVRGDIPSRTAPGENLTFPPDDVLHVADRHTVVRAYPWINTGANAKVPALSAQLWGYRDGILLPGSPISPVKAMLENISPDRELKDILMRNLEPSLLMNHKQRYLRVDGTYLGLHPRFSRISCRTCCT